MKAIGKAAHDVVTAPLSDRIDALQLSNLSPKHARCPSDGMLFQVDCSGLS